MPSPDALVPKPKEPELELDQTGVRDPGALPRTDVYLLRSKEPKDGKYQYYYLIGDKQMEWFKSAEDATTRESVEKLEIEAEEKYKQDRGEPHHNR